LRTYRKGAHSLNLFIAYYALTKPGESMHSPKNCLPGGGWEILRSGFTDLQAQGRSYSVNRYVVQKEGARQLVLYWYQSRERVVASEYTGKLLRFWDALTTGDTSGSLVRIVASDDSQGSQDARAFAAAILPDVQQVIGR
jgi:EpsI family protein